MPHHEIVSQAAFPERNSLLVWTLDYLSLALCLDWAPATIQETPTADGEVDLRRNYALDDESVTERLREVYEGTMIEDQPLLEAIKATTAGGGGYQVSAAADAAAIRAYQIVEALLAEERGRAFTRGSRRHD